MAAGTPEEDAHGGAGARRHPTPGSRHETEAAPDVRAGEEIAPPSSRRRSRCPDPSGSRAGAVYPLRLSRGTGAGSCSSASARHGAVTQRERASAVRAAGGSGPQPHRERRVALTADPRYPVRIRRGRDHSGACPRRRARRNDRTDLAAALSETTSYRVSGRTIQACSSSGSR